MDERILTALMPAIGLASGLIAAYVSLQSRALLAEVRRDLAELENRLIEKMVKAAGGGSASASRRRRGGR